jgi:hypothetical protein
VTRVLRALVNTLQFALVAKTCYENVLFMYIMQKNLKKYFLGNQKLKKIKHPAHNCFNP